MRLHDIAHGSYGGDTTCTTLHTIVFVSCEKVPYGKWQDEACDYYTCMHLPNIVDN